MNFNKAEFFTSYGSFKQIPKSTKTEIAFAGRSNVGKSSLINKIFNRKSLARVSSSPGKTITINYYSVDGKIYLVDLPGYGFAKRSDAERRRFSTLTDGYFVNNPNRDLLRLVVQLVDIRIGPTADDRMMLDYLNEAGLPYIVVATKTDKLNKTEYKASLAALREDPSIAEEAVILPFSSLKGEGKSELWKQILFHAQI